MTAVSWTTIKSLPRPNWHCVPCGVLWDGASRCWMCGEHGRRRGERETFTETIAWPS